MKRFRLDDLPLMVKVGFAPALALLMLAMMAAGAVVIQQNQMQELERVDDADEPRDPRQDGEDRDADGTRPDPAHRPRVPSR